MLASPVAIKTKNVTQAPAIGGSGTTACPSRERMCALVAPIGYQYTSDTSDAACGDDTD